MRFLDKISKGQITFSKWKRKAYAVFASLGKLIRIGKLSTATCQNFAPKDDLKKIFNNALEINSAEIPTVPWDYEEIFSSVTLAFSAYILLPFTRVKTPGLQNPRIYIDKTINSIEGSIYAISINWAL